MDDDERELRQLEHRQNVRAMNRSNLIAALAFVVSAAAVVASVWTSTDQARTSTDEFERTTRATLYNDIVGGLASPAAAVQQNAMRLLVAYVQDPANYDHDTDRQQTGARDAIQTLTAFIEDKSSVPGAGGLTDYNQPQPIILSRALDQVKILASDPLLGSHDTDVSRGNFHGISLPGFAPRGSFLAVSADFRSANLSHLDLRAQPAALQLGFYTCASLVSAKFGTANLTAADLSGADLRGADLSHVTGLTSGQLRGVTVGPRTRLPAGVRVDPTRAWARDSSRCNDLVAAMTGMHGGQGYYSSDPCPGELAAARRTTFRPTFGGNLAQLVQACALRAG